MSNTNLAGRSGWTRHRMAPLAALLTCAAMAEPASSAAYGIAGPVAPLRLVAAENVYGDLAQALGGPHVVVTSILDNPDQDPHLFEISPSIARAIAGAGIVISNGLGYDPWMETLLTTSVGTSRRVLVVADLGLRHAGDNPHLWYDPALMQQVATAISALLTRQDQAHAADYAARLERVRAAIAPVAARVAVLRARYAGTPITATEPVFGEMARAIGLDVRNERFQLAVMNDTEPAPSDVVAMEQDLRLHRVRLLITNSQASDSAARRLQGVAEQAGIPVVGVTETEPRGLDYTAWMISTLDTVDTALSRTAAAPAR